MEKTFFHRGGLEFPGRHGMDNVPHEGTFSLRIVSLAVRLREDCNTIVSFSVDRDHTSSYDKIKPRLLTYALKGKKGEHINIVLPGLPTEWVFFPFDGCHAPRELQIIDEVKRDLITNIDVFAVASVKSPQ